jgi:hypothetical protein
MDVLAALRASGAPKRGKPLVLPVAGGLGAFLSARDRRRLVSLLDPAAVRPVDQGTRAWLERRQARRSALLLVPERATAMHFAARWGLDLARIHLASDLSNPPRHLLTLTDAPERWEASSRKPWYSR